MGALGFIRRRFPFKFFLLRGIHRSIRKLLSLFQKGCLQLAFLPRSSMLLKGFVDMEVHQSFSGLQGSEDRGRWFSPPWFE